MPTVRTAFKRASPEDLQKDDGDRQPKRRRMKRQFDEEGEEGDNGTGSVADEDKTEGDMELWGEEAETVEDTKKHIHPCICDLDTRRRAKIEQFLKQKQVQQVRYEERVVEIKEELERLEEERLAQERELQEQQDLFGDEYEIVGKKKKRKKRSARRASMVSLGVKQVINWKKQPKHPVKDNAASKLRKEFTSYCGLSECPLSPPLAIDYRKKPNFEIRVTHAFDVRMRTNVKLKQFLIDSEDKRPRFDTPYYV